jgi:GNAT superfamily N-acetyltransferase
MKVNDYGAVECEHWASAGQVREYIERQGMGSMLAFDGQRYVGQLYLQEYDPDFSELGGWTGHRPWADFRVAEPLDIDGRFLTLGCYHVGWMPDGYRDRSLRGRGIGTALLRAVIDWCTGQGAIRGLLSWALVPGCKGLLEMAGQMPHDVYRRHGFQEIKKVDDPRWAELVAGFDAEEAEEDLSTLRVMRLTH